MVPRTQATIDTITSERARFEQFCRSLNAAELARPVPGSTWQVKDFISHLATIDGPIARWFGSLGTEPARGPTGDGAEAWDVDRYNDREVEKRRGLTVDEILAEAARQRAALIAVMDRLSDAQLDTTIHFGGDSKRPARDLLFVDYLKGWALHDVIHVADMLKALPERRADPTITAWLDDPRVHAVVAGYQSAMT